MTMNVKRIDAVGVMPAALVGVSATSAVAASTSTSTSPKPAASTCLPAGHDDVWPTWTNGRPGRDPGVRIWHDATGSHVRVTHDTVRDRVFSGEIWTTGALIDVHAVRLEKNGFLKVGPDKHVIVFRLNNYGGVDGIDFATHCAPFLEFGLATDGHIMPTAHISIGEGGHSPAHNPFVIKRAA